jgi:hypothetical protein
LQVSGLMLVWMGVDKLAFPILMQVTANHVDASIAIHYGPFDLAIPVPGGRNGDHVPEVIGRPATLREQGCGVVRKG